MTPRASRRGSSYVHYRPRRWIWLRSRGGSDDSSSARLGGAERCIVSAVRAGADHALMADMLFSAATDHRYLDSGHVLDFTNKAFEALDVAGWSHAETVLSSLAEGYVGARRMEESNSWRNPVDLVEILEDAFDVAEHAGGDSSRAWKVGGPRGAGCRSTRGGAQGHRRGAPRGTREGASKRSWPGRWPTPLRCV